MSRTSIIWHIKMAAQILIMLASIVLAGAMFVNGLSIH
jgi:hypothetical protein